MTFMEIARLLEISPSKAKRFYYNAPCRIEMREGVNLL